MALLEVKRKREREFLPEKEDAELSGVPSASSMFSIPDAFPLCRNPSEVLFIENKWAILHRAVCCLLQGQPSSYSFQTTHHAVFELCQRRCGVVVFHSMEKTLKWFVGCLARELDHVEDADFLQTIQRMWDHYQTALRQVSDVLIYFVKNYTVPQNKPSILALGNQLFGVGVIKRPPASSRLSVNFLSSIHQRSAAALLQAVSQMLVNLDRKGYYEPIVEKPYLDLIEAKYVALADPALLSCMVSKYLVWVDEVVATENENAHRVLCSVSVKKVEDVMRHQLVKAKAKELRAGAESLLREWDISGMKQVFDAFASVSDGPAFINSVAVAVGAEGSAIFSTQTEQQPLLRSMGIVKALLALHQRIEKFAEVLSECGNPGVMAPVTNAFTDALNATRDLPECLSHYVDYYLRQKITDEELEVVTENAISLFRFIRDKDLFELYYKRHLGSRLVASKQSDDTGSEAVFANKLKREWGSFAASRILGMLEDVEKRNELNERFAAALSRRKVTLPLSFSVTVLTMGYWPAFSEFALELPPPLRVCMQEFSEFYLRHHNGRQLKFQANMGTVQITLNHRKRYTLFATPPLACTLLCFEPTSESNLAGECEPEKTPSQVALATGMTPEEALKVLGIAAACGVLTRVPGREEDGVPVVRRGHEERFQFNTRFASPKGVVRFGGGPQANNTSWTPSQAVRGELPTTGDSSTSHRSMSIDCAIVRIMKSHRILEHTSLCKKVQESLAIFFPAATADVKSRIDALIEKRFIERTEEQEVYAYVA